MPADARMYAARNRRSVRYADEHPNGTPWGSRFLSAVADLPSAPVRSENRSTK